MKSICQLYLPAFGRSFGADSVNFITILLRKLRRAGFDGVYLIALFKDGGADNGFDIIEYEVNPAYGRHQDLDGLLQVAHSLDMLVGVDVVPNHVSIYHDLAQACLNREPGYADALYVFTQAEAQWLESAGVPNFFGDTPFSPFDRDRYLYTPFADYLQPVNNFANQNVQNYYHSVFYTLKQRGIDFARIDCGMMILPDFTQCDPENALAIFNPQRSIEAIHTVADGLPLFFEWFDPTTASLFDPYPECYALDCSYVLTGQVNTNWQHPKLIPLLGGHDQMTAADRGLDIDAALAKMAESDYGFYDLQTILHWRTDPHILPDDAAFDADLGNINQRYRARRPILPVIMKFLATS